MNPESLWTLCLLLFVDGATFAFFTTPLLLHYGKFNAPWLVAVTGGGASALGSVLQLLVLRWALASNHPWTRRWTPSRERLAATLERYPSASFLALMVARATPLPDAPLKLVAAAVGYPALRYGIAIFLGALPYYFVLAVVGSKVKIPAWILIVAMVAVVVGASIDAWRKRRRPAP